MPIIDVKNLTMCYNGVQVIDNLTLNINMGDYLLIIGENGTGKSTLLKGLLGLQKQSGGSIELNGIEKSDIGYLPQQTAAQKNFPARALEIVCSGLCGAGRLFFNKSDKAKAKAIMTELGIEKLANKPYENLSGGQQQRVLLARALVSAKKVLVLDEPTASLDLEATRELYATIARLNKEKGLTVVMVSHDLSNISDATHILNVGKHRFFGTIEEYKEVGDNA